MKVEQNLRQLNIKQIQRNNENKAMVQRPVSYTQQPKQTTFTGAGFLPFLNFLDTSPAWGACAVDFGFMVLPRTLTDFIARGPEVGVEAARREGMGAVNHASVCLYGAGAGALVAAGINRMYQLGGNYNVKANHIYADAETLDLHGGIYDAKLKASVNNPSANPLREYLSETFRRYEALSGTENGKWVRIQDESVIDRVVDVLEKEIKANSSDISKEGKAAAKNTLVQALGVENNVRIIAGQGEKLHSSRYSVDALVDNAYKLGKAFSGEKVKEAFMQAPDVASNKFLKAMKSMNMNRSLIGVGVATILGMCAQPLNMYLTRRKTGSNAFVGGGEEDKSFGFKLKKLGVSGLFGAGVLATIGNPKNLLKDIQFKSFTPTLNQFKFIYGITIMSRFMSSRNSNELTEATIKDTLGFAHWLILGNFVQKLVAQGLDKSLIKRDGMGALNWIKTSSLKTREEILQNALGGKVFKDGKALNFKAMVEALPKNHVARKQLRALTIAQLAGYLYSGLVLGVGIPKLNGYLTNTREAKKAAKAAELAKNAPAQAQDAMLKPENIQFLNQKNFTGMNLLAS
jgi:hypothetical protein